MNGRASGRGREVASALADVRHLLRQGQSQQALSRCRALRASFPDSLDVLRHHGLACVETGQYAEAEQHLTAALERAPASADLLNDFGVLRLRQGRFDEASDCFNRALELDARHAEALGNVAAGFTERGQPALARPSLQRLLERQPFSGTAHARAARNCLLLGHEEAALRLARKAVRLAPQLVEARLTLAEVLEACGRFRQARFQYLALLRRDPYQATALAKLLSMKGFRVEAQHSTAVHQLLARSGVPDGEKMQLHLALARRLDQEDRYAEAFEHLERGNAIGWQRQSFDVARFSEAVDRIIAAFPARHFRSLPQNDDIAVRPIFIVGMPRSGTTLVEQILASHPRVTAGGELPAIINLAAGLKAGGHSYPDAVPALSETERRRLVTLYVERLEEAARRTSCVTDKMPFNFMHVGFITTLFPDAAVVHCRRDPRDTCLSCLFTSFGKNLLFAGDLRALGHYYLDYSRLMAHWMSVLPQPPLEVEYERLVTDTESTVRLLLKHCGLEWDSSCVEFYRTDRGIRTPSRWQVRQPIYHRSIGRWRHYARQLEPLIATLEPLMQEQAGERGSADA